jgi:hypothetical protein
VRGIEGRRAHLKRTGQTRMFAPEFAQSVQSRTSEYENIGPKGRVYIFGEEGVKYDEKNSIRIDHRGDG